MVANFASCVLSASRVQDISFSHLHSKLALYGSMVDIQSATAENRRGKEEEEETTAAQYNGSPIGRP